MRCHLSTEPRVRTVADKCVLHSGHQHAWNIAVSRWRDQANQQYNERPAAEGCDALFHRDLSARSLTLGKFAEPAPESSQVCTNR
jgi:hypothetical protein